MEIDGREFEQKIFVKQDVAALLARDVSQKYSYESKASGYTQSEHIAIGTATDPYQPAEKEYRVTRACLEELARRDGLSVSVITKSNQIVRDIDILKVIAAKSALSLNVTVTTLKPRLPPAAGDYRWRGRTRTSRCGCQGSGRAVVLLRRPVSDAGFGKDIPAVHLGKISAPGQAI
jgi:hypothetical protein